MKELALHTLRCRPGTAVFREGEPGDCAYLIERGRVEITAELGGEKRVLGSLGPGQVLGELAVIDNTVRSATATATEETELTVVRREQLQMRLDAAEPVLRLLLKVILERFRHERRFLRGNGADGDPGGDPSPPAGREGDEGALGKIKLESELWRALSQEELELYYQPIFDLARRSLIGFEALLRWNHPERRLVLPNEFIGVAEESALIVPIGRWALLESCRRLREFQEAMDATAERRTPLLMCVNVSGRQVADPGFVRDLATIVQQTGVDPQRLCLEITEGVLIDYPSALSWIEQCRAIGATVALDDFGTGYSSLSYLSRFPIDKLKIDRSFVQAVPDDPKSLAIVRAVTQLAHGIGLQVVAEGIEASEQLSALTGMSCEYGEGHLFSPAVGFDQALRLLGQPLL